MSRRKVTSENECPICGGVIWGKGKKVLIEGAKMTVCNACAQHGIKIKPNIQRIQQKTSLPKKPSKPTYKTSSFKPKDDFDEFELVADYADRIRKARIKSNLSQELFAQKIHEKVSLMKRIETGKAKPTISLAKKIEKTYNISLLQKNMAQEEINYKSYIKRGSRSSLGDIAFIKKRK
ncbi:MAG: multiprotein bridging factor aMBF1 [Promethearchaeota archaeon]